MKLEKVQEKKVLAGNFYFFQLAGALILAFFLDSFGNYEHISNTSSTSLEKCYRHSLKTWNIVQGSVQGFSKQNQLIGLLHSIWVRKLGTL